MSHPRSDHSRKSAHIHQPHVDHTTPRSHLHSHINPVHSGIQLDTAGIETEMRHDYLHDKLVIIAPNRGMRPYDTHSSGHTLIETASSPQLDLNSPVWQIDGRSKENWLVKIVENKYPSLTMNNPQAYGKQEIIIDTPLASKPFSSLSEVQITTLLEAYQRRTTELMAQNGIEYVLVFRNDGYGAGASLAHAHSQIFALPMVPEKFVREARLAREYEKQNKRNAYDDIMDYELRTKSRIVAQDEHWLVFCPYASQWPFELWLMPRRHIMLSTELEQPEINTLASHLKRYTHQLTSNNIDHNLYLENGADEHQRFCIKLCGRSNIWGGLEVATDIIINTVPPESAAKWYKK